MRFGFHHSVARLPLVQALVAAAPGGGDHVVGEPTATNDFASGTYVADGTTLTADQVILPVESSSYYANFAPGGAFAVTPDTGIVVTQVGDSGTMRQAGVLGPAISDPLVTGGGVVMVVEAVLTNGPEIDPLVGYFLHEQRLVGGLYNSLNGGIEWQLFVEDVNTGTETATLYLTDGQFLDQSLVLTPAPDGRYLIAAEIDNAGNIAVSVNGSTPLTGSSPELTAPNEPADFVALKTIVSGYNQTSTVTIPSIDLYLPADFTTEELITLSTLDVPPPPPSTTVILDFKNGAYTQDGNAVALTDMVQENPNEGPFDPAWVIPGTGYSPNEYSAASINTTLAGALLNGFIAVITYRLTRPEGLTPPLFELALMDADYTPYVSFFAQGTALHAEGGPTPTSPVSMTSANDLQSYIPGADLYKAVIRYSPETVTYSVNGGANATSPAFVDTETENSMIILYMQGYADGDEVIEKLEFYPLTEYTDDQFPALSAVEAPPPPESLTSYSNPGGTGYRTMSLPTNFTTQAGDGPIAKLVDGSFVTDSTGSTAFTDGENVAGWSLQFGISSAYGGAKIIDEFKWYQNGIATHGQWEFQGFINGEWTALASFTLGGSTTQTISFANATPCSYYRLFGVSGVASGLVKLLEIEFKISA